jgi:hypothetical protein
VPCLAADAEGAPRMAIAARPYRIPVS